MRFKPTATALFAAVAMAVAAPLAAQQTIEPTKIEADQVTDEQVNAFAEAFVAVEQVRIEYTPKIRAEEDPEKRKEIIAEADAAGAKAVLEVENMTIEDYFGIALAARQDKDLNERINARLDEVQPQEAQPEETQSE